MSVQQPLDLINLKREHVKWLANQKGAAGELEVLAANVHYVARPKGAALNILMAALRERGAVMKRSSFDAIALPEGRVVDFADPAAVATSLSDMVFVEIKTANQKRLRTPSIPPPSAQKRIVRNPGEQTGTMLLTSVPEILARACSTNWQVSVQL
jgi:hypothetical protein